MDTEVDRTEEGNSRGGRPQSVGGCEGGKEGLARMGAEAETERGKVHQGGEITVFRGLCHAGHWLIREMFVKSSQQNAMHVLGRIFAFLRGSQASYGRRINYQLGVCVTHIFHPNTVLKNTLREHFLSTELEDYFESIMSLFVSLKRHCMI